MATELMSAILIAPFVCVAAALSLTSLQRGLEWIEAMAKAPASKQTNAILVQLKPTFKVLKQVIDRIFEGNKFERTADEILLMSIVIMLVCLYLKPAAPVNVSVQQPPAVAAKNAAAAKFDNKGE